MNFETFNQLAHNNRMVLLMAIDLLMQDGRGFVQEAPTAALVSIMKASVKNLMAGSMLEEIVKTAQALAPLRTCEVLDYVKRSELEFKKPGAQESGICPICGGNLEYGTDEPIDDGGLIEWTCLDCGATGKEGYDKVFDQHYNVYDADGIPFPATEEQI